MKWIILPILAFAAMGCSSNEQPASGEDVPLNESGMSIYLLDEPWVNQNGDTIQLSDLQGSVVVGAMIYTSCDVACPRIVSDLKRVEDWAEENEVIEDLKFLLISFDSKIDTPEKLRQFAQDASLDLSKWTLLHGSEDQILELAAVLNVKYKRTTDVHFTHSNLLHVLNRQGELVYQKEGFDTDLSKVESAIRQLLEA